MNAKVFGLMATIGLGAPSGGLAEPQLFDSDYKGTLECESTPSGVGIFRTQLVLGVRDGQAIMSAPILNIDGAVQLSATVATGTVGANGALHLACTVFERDATGRCDYVGTMDPAGGALTGTQVWSRAIGGERVTRTCKGTFLSVGSSRR